MIGIAAHFGNGAAAVDTALPAVSLLLWGKNNAE